MTGTLTAILDHEVTFRMSALMWQIGKIGKIRSNHRSPGLSTSGLLQERKLIFSVFIPLLFTGLDYMKLNLIITDISTKSNF